VLADQERRGTAGYQAPPRIKERINPAAGYKTGGNPFDFIRKQKPAEILRNGGILPSFLLKSLWVSSKRYFALKKVFLDYLSKNCILYAWGPKKTP
jgi:hypothetical protein